MITIRIKGVDIHNIIVLTDDVLDHLGAKEGDELCFSKLPDGFRLTKADPEVARQMKAADEIAVMHYDTLKELGPE